MNGIPTTGTARLDPFLPAMYVIAVLLLATHGDQRGRK